MRSIQARLEKKTITYILWSVIIGITFLLSVISLTSGSYLRSIDTFYYLSIADNYLNNGIFLDGTTIPNGPVITPQNGIVGIFCLFRMLSFSKHQCLLLILGINYVLLLSCFYPLIQICKSVGLDKRYLIFCILFAFVGSLRIFVWLYMAPLNDMVFYTGQLWFLYLVIFLVRRFSEGEKKEKRVAFLIAAGIVLSIFLIHFRLNIIFIPVSGLLSAIILRRYRVIPLMLVFIASMLLSMFSSYVVVDQYDFHISTARIGPLFGDFGHQVYVFLFRILPESLFKDLNQTGNLLYMAFYLSLPLALIDGVRKKNFLLLMLVFICGMTFALTLLHGNLTERYLWAVTAFMYILLLRIKGFRGIGILFISAVLINTGWSLDYRAPQAFAWKDIANEVVVQQDNLLMLSKDHRSCWYFTGNPSVFRNEYTWEQLANASAICVIGPQYYVDDHLVTIEEYANTHRHQVTVRYIDYGSNRHSDLLLCEITLHPQCLP